jgi:hypothetical protein
MRREKTELLKNELIDLLIQRIFRLIANKKIAKIYAVVANMSSALLAVVPNVIAYAGNITRRYPV